MEPEAKKQAQNRNLKNEADAIARYRLSLSGLYRKDRERIDALGYRAFSQGSGDAQRLSAYNELIELLWRSLTPNRKNRKRSNSDSMQGDVKEEALQNSEQEEILLAGLSEFFATRLSSYDPNESFYTFLLQSAPYAILDNIRRESGFQPLPDWAMEELLRKEGKSEEKIRQEMDAAKATRKRMYGSITDSIDAPVSSDDPCGTSIGEMLPGGRSPEKELIDDSAEPSVLRMLAALLNVRTQLKGKENNPARINFFRLFYTDTVVFTLRDVSGLWRDYRRHEREILRQLKPLFLSFTLRLDFPELPLDECFMPLADDYCSFSAVAAAPARLESEVLPDGKNKQLKEPFKDEVLAAYLTQKEQRAASREAVSQNRGYFLAYLRRCGVGR